MLVESRPIVLKSLPNEIIIAILSNLSTRDLLLITPTSRRIHALILRILRQRLLTASSLPNHQLVFECFHPSAKWSTPFLQCEFTGTSALPSNPNQDNNTKSKEQEPEISLSSFSNLYSHFRPLKPSTDTRTPRAHPAGGFLAQSPLSNALVNEDSTDLVCQNIHLESHELFSQLCTVTNVVKNGPSRGIFVSCVGVGEGIVRVWRDWLGRRCKGEGDGMLWGDSRENVGLRVDVVERFDVTAPVVVGREEDEAVSYTLQYEEVVVRTTQLLFKLEKTMEQEIKNSGKAIVIGSWDQ